MCPLNSSLCCRVKPRPHPPSSTPRPNRCPRPPSAVTQQHCLYCPTKRMPIVVLCIVMIKSPSASGNLEGGSRRQSARTRKVTGRLLAAPACLLSMPCHQPLLCCRDSAQRPAATKAFALPRPHEATTLHLSYSSSGLF